MADSNAQRVRFGGNEGLLWGSGDYGVVLSHGLVYDAASWTEQGRALAESGMIALAVEDTSPDSLARAVRYLKEEHGARAVAVVGASAGAKTAIEAASANPGLIDQMVLLSPAGGDVTTLWRCPKLFVASEGEGITPQVRQMAEQAPGNHNEELILPGEAHAQAIFATEQGEPLLKAILNRLKSFASV